MGLATGQEVLHCYKYVAGCLANQKKIKTKQKANRYNNIIRSIQIYLFHAIFEMSMSIRPSGLILKTCHMSCNCYLKYCGYHNLMPSIWLDIENLWLSAKQLIKCMMDIWPCQMIIYMLLSHRLGWSTYIRLLLIFMYFAHPNNNWSMINMNRGISGTKRSIFHARYRVDFHLCLITFFHLKLATCIYSY